jgi:error-prone DNA polymerase
VQGDSIGVFQVESRAQINMLPRLRPRVFYDLVIEVAIVRPGPIQGDMVHPYLRRRNGRKRWLSQPRPRTWPDGRTGTDAGTHQGRAAVPGTGDEDRHGAAEFTPDEANGLRRAMATFRHVGTIHNYEEMMVEGMVKRGYDAAFAERCFNQIKGFGEYGFPESHAASFAQARLHLVLDETPPSGGHFLPAPPS